MTDLPHWKSSNIEKNVTSVYLNLKLHFWFKLRIFKLRIGLFEFGTMLPNWKSFPFGIIPEEIGYCFCVKMGFMSWMLCSFLWISLSIFSFLFRCLSCQYLIWQLTITVSLWIMRNSRGIFHTFLILLDQIQVAAYTYLDRVKI